MKRSFKFYIVFWSVLVAVFNVIAFVSTGWVGQEKYTPAFWCGYIFIMLAFVVNLIYATMALYSNDVKKIFYNIAFFRGSYAGLILAFVTGGLFMLIPVMPYWVCILIAVIVAGGNTISLIKAKTAATIVAEVDEKVVTSTQFIKILTADAQSLVTAAKTNEARELAQRVYEAARYSDPVSTDALAGVEQQIESALAAFTTAILTNAEDPAAAAETLLYLINNRNEKCKVLK